MEGVANDVVFKARTTDSLLDSRTVLWSSAIASIQQHPLFGIGHGVGEGGGDADISLIGAMTSSTATNEKGSSWLGLVEELGLVGSIPAFSVFAMILWRILRVVVGLCPERFPGVTIALAGIMAAGIANLPSSHGCSHLGRIAVWLTGVSQCGSLMFRIQRVPGWSQLAFPQQGNLPECEALLFNMKA